MKSMTRTSPLAVETAWRDEVAIVPYSGIQILDFGFRQSDLDLKNMRFVERILPGTTAAGSADPGLEERTLIPLTGDEDRDAELMSDARPDDDEYSVSTVAAMDPFLESWVPVPVLRIKSARGPGGEELYDPGPSAWALLRTVRLPAPDPESGHTHRVQLALDTALAAEQGDLFYAAPDRSDAQNGREFRLVSDPERMDWFLRRLETDSFGQTIDPQSWVSDHLDELFITLKRAERPGRPLSHENLPHRLEHWARYLAYLRVLTRAIRFPLLRLVNTVGENDAISPVEVDLVLDIGNSRTCGILIERMPGEARLDPARSYPLEIRDLSRPEFLYSGLVESRVEFSEFRMCEEVMMRRARRASGFTWPSPVRIGPEAMRLVAQDEGTETISGLSSPKRYLWDEAPVMQDWRFHNHGDPNNLPRAARSAMRFLNAAGDVIEQVKAEEDSKLRARGKTPKDPAGRPRFSRSSLFGFMLAETFAHALVQVNSPAGRARRPQSDLPRRLDRIILTLPTATSIQEQAIIRSRAKGALALIWSMMGLKGTESTVSRPPELTVEWDEASCTQLVYLFSEITQKFAGHIDRFLSLKGRPRPRLPGQATEPSLRLACIDVGGGTTDLMVTTYFGQENRVLHPEQTFREGFRVAGDELVQRVISAVILPRLQDEVTARGGRFVGEKIRELFAGDLGGQDQQIVQKRRQFALRVLHPLALELISRCETVGEFDTLSLQEGEVLGLPATPPDDSGPQDRPPQRIPQVLLDYLEEPMRALGASGFRLADAVIHCSRAEVDAIARETFQKVLGNLAEVLDHLSVDIVLLTGRPSRLPAVRTVFEEMLVVPPHRLVSMHSYRTGRWYPFRDPVTQRIGDPKSTVAVGGMLIALSEGRIPNFKVTAGAFKMRSTANFIGEMDSSGAIPAERVLFHGTEMESKGEERAQLRMFSPVFLGARQLRLERWTTTPLYRIDYVNSAAQKHPPPLVITLQRAEFDGDPDDTRPDTALRREAAREAFKIDEIENGEGTTIKSDQVVLRLHTLGADDDYWIDTGLFKL